MKKLLCILMCAVLLLAFPGCAPSTEQTEQANAVDLRIVDVFGSTKAEAVKALGLSEEDGAVLAAEYSWCGMPMETEFGFFEDVFDYAAAKAMFPDTEDTEKLLEDCLRLFEEQFGEPFGCYLIDAYSGGMTVVEQLPTMESVLDVLSEADNGIGFRYGLRKGYDGTGEREPVIDLAFTKYSEEPENIRITIAIQNY